MLFLLPFYSDLLKKKQKRKKRKDSDSSRVKAVARPARDKMIRATKNK